MVTPYATTADLAAYLGVAVGALPADAARLLQRASDDLYSYVSRNLVATNTSHMTAMKDATCAQVEYMISLGESSSIGGAVQSFSIGATSMTFDSATGSRSIGSRAIRYLNNEGLLFRGIRVAGRLGDDDL